LFPFNMDRAAPSNSSIQCNKAARADALHPRAVEADCVGVIARETTVGELQLVNWAVRSLVR
jgi:hypothetical protein